MQHLSAEDDFPFFDAVANVECQTDSSVVLRISMLGNELELDGQSEPMKFVRNCVYTVIGHLDIHHPCHDDIHKLYIRGRMPTRFVEHCKEFVRIVCALIEIDSETPYKLEIETEDYNLLDEEPKTTI